MKAILLLTVACLLGGCVSGPDPVIGRPKIVKEARSYIGLTYSEVVGGKGVVYKRSHEGNPPHGRVMLDDGTSYGYVYGMPQWSQIFFDKDNRVYRIRWDGEDTSPFSSKYRPRSAEWSYDISADQ